MENRKQNTKRPPKRYWVKKLHKYISVMFIAIVFVITIVNVIKKDSDMSERENRMLAKSPAISFDEITSGRFMENYETYKSDQFIARDFWIAFKTQLDSLCGKNYSNGVYKGKKGYLIEDAVKPDEENLKKNIDAINKLADNQTAKVYTMIVPNAVAVLSDLLPPFAPVRSQEQDLENFRLSLSENVTDIDVTETLKNHKNEQLYYHTDHHWTSRGAYYSFLTAAEFLGIENNGMNYATYKVCSDFVGTMASTSGYTGKKDTIEVFIPTDSSVQYIVNYVEEQKKTASLYQSEKLESYDKYAFFFGGNSPIIRISTTASTGKNLLVLKDSYANCFLPFLIPYYDEIVVIDPRYYYDDIYSEITSQKITEILFLYNANTFLEDNSISGIFTQYE